MATIYFSMAGEGRGHATRVRSMVEPLRDAGDHIELFAGGDAYDLLAPIYRGTAVRVHRIPCPRFAYTADKRLDSVATLLGGMRYFLRLPRLVGKLERYLRRHPPDLVIVDFEPALPRAAERAGVPYISVDHQHTFVADQLTLLPPYWRLRAWLIGFVVRLYHRKERHAVISQFFFPPVKPKWRGRVTHAGVLLRPEVIAAQTSDAGFLLVYLKKFGTPNIMAALRRCGLPVRLYGLGEQEPEGNITYCKVDNHAFVRDLASCTALLCSSGNQLIGEALYFGKPVFALPEPNNDEQIFNCHYLSKSGAGAWAEMDHVTPEEVRTFLENVDKYRGRIDREKMNGTPVALAAIRRQLRELGVE